MKKRHPEWSETDTNNAQTSFSMLEKKWLPKLRKGLNKAEFTEDVKKVFCAMTKNLLNNAYGGAPALELEDLVFVAGESPHYQLRRSIFTQKAFADLWDSSDLHHIVSKFASLASNRYLHLLKNPDKTESKMHRSGRAEGRPL